MLDDWVYGNLGYRVSDHTASHNRHPPALASFTGLQAQEGRVVQFNIGHMQFYVFDFNLCGGCCVSVIR